MPQGLGVLRPAVAALAACLLLVLAACGTGSLATSDASVPSAVSSSAPLSPLPGPTVIVTVPDLLLPSAEPVVTAAPVAPSLDVPSVAETTEVAASPAETPAAGEPVAEPTTEANDDPQPEPAQTPEPAAPPPPGEGLNVSLANCDGCTVLASHRDVTGGLSAALVGTPTGRAILLSVGGDGQVSGVIGVPYGAAFAAPTNGVLACAQGRCVVEGRQNDGRAILSAFELTGSGAWRDVSGDDAFPSATERAAVIDLDGELGIAVQDQAAGPAVWMLYTWGGDRYSVLGCAADGAAPTSADAVSPALCLS